MKEVTKEKKAATQNFNSWIRGMKERGILEEKSDKEEMETEVSEDTETKADTEEQAKPGRFSAEIDADAVDAASRFEGSA